MHWPSHMESLARAGSTPALAPVYGRMLLYTAALIVIKGLPFARTVRYTVNDDDDDDDDDDGQVHCQ